MSGRPAYEFLKRPAATEAGGGGEEFGGSDAIPLPYVRATDACDIRIVGRRCAVCGCTVTNENLGGDNGRSALSGELFCLTCADGRRDQ